MAFYVYMLRCSDGSFYIGQTDNIERRLAEHKDGKTPCFTQTRLPVQLVYMQEFGGRDEAITAERQIKKWNRQKKEALIKNNWEKIHLLAKKKFN